MNTYSNTYTTTNTYTHIQTARSVWRVTSATPATHAGESLHVQYIHVFLWRNHKNMNKSLHVQYIHVFLWRNHKNMNNVVGLVTPVYAMDTYICKINVRTKQAKYE